MGKILQYLLIFGAIWLIIHLLRNRLAGPRATERPLREVRTVRCAHCGVHLPEPDAVRGEGRDYCSAEHRNLGPRGE